jgi:alkanesulfonate monooxygenase SsuD/methylene tetrahydromethanopterin reductase-like flavin-dependent oxidoreductase (luciferase family)
MKVGVAIRLAEDLGSGDVANGMAPSYTEIRATAIRAEEAGFDSIWVADHLLYRRQGQPTMGIWEAWTMLAALAEVTHRVELGTITLCASFRNPAVLAKMAVTLDEVSGGRLILGIGAGWNESEYRAFGLPFDRRVDRFEEALRVIVPLLREGRVTFDGRYFSVQDCELAPRGPRSEGPPLLIGASGPRMLHLAARHADLWNEAEYLVCPEPFAARRAAFEAAQAEVGGRAMNVGLSVTLRSAGATSVRYPASSMATISPAHPTRSRPCSKPGPIPALRT